MNTASALDRIAACPASEALPHALRTNDDAKRGHARHAFFEAIPNIGREEALKLAPEKYRDELALIDLSVETGIGEFLDGTKFLQEVAFAYDPATDKARVLGQGLKRNYSSALPDEVVGTCDIVGVTADAVVIPDFKGAHAQLEPKEMRQLLFLAMVACKVYDRQRAVSGVIRIREDGSSFYQRVDFDEFDLASFQLELPDIVARVEDAKQSLQANMRPVSLIEGEHCRYCPAFPFCPAKMALVRSFAAAPESLQTSLDGATDEQLALAWERVTALEAVVKRVRENIQTRARQHAIPLGKGQVLGECPVEIIKPEVASMVLEALYGEEVAAGAVEVKESITKSSVDAALRKHVLKPGMQITKMNKDTIDAIRQAEGVVVRFDVKKRKATPEEIDWKPVALPESDAKTDLQEMLAEGVRQNEESLKASGGGA